MTAVKVLPKKLGNNPHLVERFYREARTLSRLDHPNIVTVFDACEARGYHYMAMTYVDGFTLRERLERQGRLPEREVLPILLQVARALQHMHDCGYLHRNIIPSKVMASGSGRARLVGLGTSWEIRDLKAAMAEAGTLLGTPSYMSPEQIRGEVNIDPRSDIYGLGANLYHLVTGKRPFEGNTPAAIIHKHLKEPLNPPDHLCTAVSSATSRMVERMMAKQPEERYASMNEVAIEVEKLIR